MNCPVCERESGAARACPACGTDLGVLLCLQELPATLAAEGEKLLREGRPIEAAEKLSAVVALRPGDSAARRALAEVLASAGMDELAWHHLAKCDDEAGVERLRRKLRVRASINRLVRAFASYLT